MLITPGAMQFTVIPLGASSFARAFVRPIIPALDAEYTTSQEAPTSPQIDDIFIILQSSTCLFVRSRMRLTQQAVMQDVVIFPVYA